MGSGRRGKGNLPIGPPGKVKSALQAGNTVSQAAVLGTKPLKEARGHEALSAALPQRRVDPYGEGGIPKGGDRGLPPGPVIIN